MDLCVLLWDPLTTMQAIQRHLPLPPRNAPHCGVVRLGIDSMSTKTSPLGVGIITIVLDATKWHPFGVSLCARNPLTTRQAIHKHLPLPPCNAPQCGAVRLGIDFIGTMTSPLRVGIITIAIDATKWHPYSGGVHMDTFGALGPRPGPQIVPP